MKELYLYLLENINIFESATGVKITNKNINTIIDYLSEYQYGVKCIIPDTDEIRNNYIELEEWFCGYNDISKALFFLKSNGMLCMYEPNVKSMSDKELEDLHITRKGEAYYLPGITTKLEATSKRLNSAKTDIKIWPESWDKYIVKGSHKVDRFAQLPTTVIDFKNQGAYIIPIEDFDKIKPDLYNSFVKNFGNDSLLSEIFDAKDIKKFLSNLDSEERKEISNSMANVLSEPLSILYLLDDTDNVQTIIRKSFDELLGEIDQIIIPISQNWPVADFYVHFKEMPARLVAISVKSNGAGNTSTVLNCLPVADVNKVSPSDKDIKALKEFFEETLPQFNSDKKFSLNVSKSISSKLKNVAMYALYILKEQTKESKIKNADKLINTFEDLVGLVENTEVYEQLYKICKLGGTNVIEKFLIALFNTNEQVLSIIKNAVADATSCYKITVYDNGKASVLKQSPDNNSFRLKMKQGGQGLDFKFDKGKLVDITLGHKTSQGQWIGYEFH